MKPNRFNYNLRIEAVIVKFMMEKLTFVSQNKTGDVINRSFYFKMQTHIENPRILDEDCKIICNEE